MQATNPAGGAANQAPSAGEGGTARERLRRWACLTTLAGVGVYTTALGLSMALYPGGTWFDREATGYSFWSNFWCDLLRATAHNGEPNELGSRLALAGWLALSVALGPFWWAASQAPLGAPRRALWVRVLGPFSSIAMCSVFLLPSDRFPQGHALAIALAGPPGLTAVVLAVSATSTRALPPVLRASGLGLALFGSMNFVQYARQVWCDAPDSQLLPGIQKFATGFALLWIVLMVQQAMPRSAETARASAPTSS